MARIIEYDSEAAGLAASAAALEARRDRHNVPQHKRGPGYQWPVRPLTSGKWAMVLPDDPLEDLDPADVEKVKDAGSVEFADE